MYLLGTRRVRVKKAASGRFFRTSAPTAVGRVPPGTPRIRSIPLDPHYKEYFFRNAVYLERGMPYFAFVDTDAVLVRKDNESKMNFQTPER